MNVFGAANRRATVAAIAASLAIPLAAEERPSVAPRNMQEIAPQLADYTDEVLFGDIWVRPDLSPRDRSLVTLSALVATGKTAQLPGHLARGLSNGLKSTEVAGLVTHLAFYTGWPNAVSALNVVEDVFGERNIKVETSRIIAPGPATPVPPIMRKSPGGQQVVPDSTKFAQLTNDVLFGDLWQRTDLTARDRSLVTIAALSTIGESEQLEDYIRRGLASGLTKLEIGEALTHLAFYAGWPRATAAIEVAEKAFGERDVSVPPAPPLTVVSPGNSPLAAPAANFTGSAIITSPFQASGDSRIGGATVTFGKGARTNWHTHPRGQLLIVTDGKGWVQAKGEPVREVRPGDVVWTAPGIKHWHGGTRTSAMTHVAVAESSDGASVTWLERVSDSQYAGPQ